MDESGLTQRQQEQMAQLHRMRAHCERMAEQYADEQYWLNTPEPDNDIIRGLVERYGGNRLQDNDQYL